MTALSSGLRGFWAGLLVAAFAVTTGCSREGPEAGTKALAVAAPAAAAVDGQRIQQADQQPGNWLAHGRTYSEQRFSPLSSLDTSNVDELGLAWYFDLPDDRGIEATPIVVDGVMYVTGPTRLPVRRA